MEKVQWKAHKTYCTTWERRAPLTFDDAGLVAYELSLVDMRRYDLTKINSVKKK
ncbi:hypothetical protein HDV05_007567 [Chytridiales sp. JEL 0842]|nr:hypothetical protein HDV05_007567 [Chytridiales sp. JEL 0842]